jgi:hypothetical protein
MVHARKSLPFRRVHAIAAAVLSACILLLVGITSTADAAVQASTPPPTVTSTTSTSTVTPALKGVGPTTITCTAIANNPHNSSHVGGTVNFVGSIKCTAPVASLRMTVSLHWDGYVQGSKSNSNAGKASLSNNVAAACTSGGWQGSTVGTVTFPAGYTPHSGTVSASKVVSISC